MHEAVPSETVTAPVGVPAPGAATATENVTSTEAPAADGFGVCETIAVVVGAADTVWPAVPELAANVADPAYDAVTVRTPAVGNVRGHSPTATDAVHDSTPSVTVTSPPGDPASLVTEKWNVTGCPETDVSGSAPEIVVTVGASPTSCVSVSLLAR